MSQNEIVSETNYYPFGLEHKGYNEHVNSTNLGEQFKFNGKELNDEMDLGWYDFGARPYMPDINRTPTIDPLADDPTQIDKSPYAMFWNNPMKYVDPTGMISEDWIPKVKKNGSTSYIAEKGDSAATLASQYGVSLDNAEAITGTTGTNEIAAGTEVSGQDVANVTGSEVLKLDVASKEGQSEQRRFDQFLYARDHASSKGMWSFLSTDYFSNTTFMDMMSGNASININGQNIGLHYEIPMYRSATFDGSSPYSRLGVEALFLKPTSGMTFPNNQHNIQMPLYHSNGARNREYEFFVHSKNSSALMSRLNKSFPNYNYGVFKKSFKN